MPNDSAEIGRAAERRAADWLSARGWRILARNFRTRRGEIDIVAQDGDAVVFVEVRSRSRRDYGGPAETVGWLKQRRLRAAAAVYASRLDPTVPLRFDVISVEPEGIEHIVDAFGG